MCAGVEWATMAYAGCSVSPSVVRYRGAAATGLGQHCDVPPRAAGGEDVEVGRQGHWAACIEAAQRVARHRRRKGIRSYAHRSR